MTHTLYTKFKFQRLRIKFYWHGATFFVSILSVEVSILSVYMFPRVNIYICLYVLVRYIDIDAVFCLPAVYLALSLTPRPVSSTQYVFYTHLRSATDCTVSFLNAYVKALTPHGTPSGDRTFRK